MGIRDIHEKIIERSKAGNRKAQFELYNLYSKAMFNICLRMMNNREEAEDVLQDSFIDAFKRLDSFRYESTFGAWLKTIVINHCINEIKRKKADLVLVDDMYKYQPEEDDPINEEQLELSVQRVKNAMRHLPDGGRVILTLYLFEGYDHREIARIMDITESTSKSQYMRAKRRIKELLQN